MHLNTAAETVVARVETVAAPAEEEDARAKHQSTDKPLSNRQDV